MPIAFDQLGPILLPVTPEEFLARYHGKAMLHVPGTADKFAHLMSWSRLNALLDMDVWSAATLQMLLDRQSVPPEAYCARSTSRDGQPVLKPKVDRVMALVRQGASLVCNKIESLTPELGALARMLSETLGGRIGINLYCSWERHQAFNAHFDTHDVFVFHVEGEKTWNIYEGRIDNPVEHPAFDMPLERRNELKGKVQRAITLRPGDFLYLPRGQFHDALATSPGSVHLTVAVNEPVGLDWLGRLIELAVQDPAFRADLPRASGEAGQAALAAHRRALAERLAAIANSPQALDMMRGMRMSPPLRPRQYALPEHTGGTHYRVRADGMKVVRRGAEWLLKGSAAAYTLSPGDEPIVAWVIERAHFSANDLARQFAGVDAASRQRVIDTLRQLAVLEAA
jgi:bifunctional lysine-specific demethylase and histidyl-hydroxylase MINA